MDLVFCLRNWKGDPYCSKAVDEEDAESGMRLRWEREPATRRCGALQWSQSLTPSHFASPVVTSTLSSYSE